MRKLALFIFSFIIWYLLTWPFDFTTRTLDWQMLIAGCIVSLLATIILGEVFRKHKHKRFVLLRYFWALAYIPVLFYYMLLANFDVLYRVVHPAMPINPGIVKVKTKLTTDTGKTALANSITLTPGTLTVDINSDGVIYVHCINIKETKTVEATQEIVGRFEKILVKIFE
ncbi:MAG: Na+/H+ antiporter subunit E [Spirochaetales bacterium]|nr:Na+/H+ antiporter subunit E [Spirochaetales bacterium]